MILLCSLNENDIRTTWRNTIFTIIPISGAFLPCNEFKSSLTHVDFFFTYTRIETFSNTTGVKKTISAQRPKVKDAFSFLVLIFIDSLQDSTLEGLLTSNTMDQMEPECIRSFNGYRSTIELLKLVPNKEVRIVYLIVRYSLKRRKKEKKKQCYNTVSNKNTHLPVFDHLSYKKRFLRLFASLSKELSDEKNIFEIRSKNQLILAFFMCSMLTDLFFYSVKIC